MIYFYTAVLVFSILVSMYSWSDYVQMRYGYNLRAFILYIGPIIALTVSAVVLSLSNN